MKRIDVLDPIGVRYLWKNIKTLVSTKANKVSSSTDNAIVRFDGTTGAIQNSGVTIDDNNKVYAKAFVTDGGNDEQYVMGDGSLDTIESFTDSEMDVLLDASDSPSLNCDITTTSEPANGDVYDLGETITYQIDITNDGNLTISDITCVADGKTLTSILPKRTLAPAESMSVPFHHAVDENDILAGSVKFDVTVDGYNDSEDPTDPCDSDVENPVMEPNPSIEFSMKLFANTGSEIGETVSTKPILGRLRVENTGNISIYSSNFRLSYIGASGYSSTSATHVSPHSHRDTSYFTLTPLQQGTITVTATFTSAENASDETTTCTPLSITKSFQYTGEVSDDVIID